MKKINHHIINLIIGVIKFIGMVVFFIIVVCLILAVITGIPGCRSVKKTTSDTHSEIDTNSYQKNDSLTHVNTINYSELLSAKRVVFHIVYDSASKPSITIITGQKSIVDNIINSPNQKIKSIDIEADNASDSSSYKSTDTNNENKTVIAESSKKIATSDNSSKTVTIYTGLLIVAGIVGVILIIFFALFSYFKNTTGSGLFIIEKIKTFLK